MSNKETQYTGLYGKYASGKHYLGDTLTYGLAQKATVIWSFRNEQDDIVYVVDDGSFPFEMKESSLSSEELERKKYLHMVGVSDVMPDEKTYATLNLNFGDEISFTHAEVDGRYSHFGNLENGPYEHYKVVDFTDNDRFSGWSRLGVRKDGFNGQSALYYVRCKDVIEVTHEQ